MNTIGNKMFAYIDNHAQLTQSMVNQYNESLIFLGDEKQIFVPIINAYVGIGQTAYNYLLSRIGQNNDDLIEYNKYIHKDTVNGIYVQYSPNEIKTAIGDNTSININGKNVNKDTAYTMFKANTNVVLKGINDYELVNGQDGLGRSVGTANTSGITINITREGTQQIGKYTIKDSNGVPHEYTYSYYDPYDVISIDDTKTWSYIKSSNSYLTEFITKFSAEQANRVYKNILGIESGTIYIEKEFDEAFNYSDVTKTINEFAPVYIKTTNGTYQKVTIENEAGKGFAVIYGGNVIWTNITPNSNNQITINGTTRTVLLGDDLITILDKNGDNPDNPTSTTGTKYGYIVSDDGNGLMVIIPRWYHEDTFNGSSSYINIADGIQTLKEVAYVLNKITDGSDDDAINLAYNISYNFIEIQKLQDWKSKIGNETVSSFKSESGNELLTVNYYSTNLWDGKDRDTDDASIGKVKLDIDLKLAQTYEITGVTYAAYLPNHEGAKKSYFIYNGDETNINNYKLITSNNTDNYNLVKSHPSYNNDNVEIPIYTITFDTNNKVIGKEIVTPSHTVGNLANPGSDLIGKYIYFPYVKAIYDFTKGLTNVKWVTSYVREVYNDLNNRINTLDVSGQIDAAINLLDYSDTDQSSEGQFVTKVDEVDGKISVTRKKLPLDTILKNDVYYTNDIYLHISTATARSLFTNPNTTVYKFENNKYVLVSTDSEFANYDDNDYSKFYRKTSLASMTAVPTTATVGDMILNGANVTYFWKKVTNGYTEYLPLDIQTAYTTGSLFNNDKPAADNSIYYWNKTSNQVKYFDLNTILQKNGSTTTIFTSYITYLAASSATNSGLADAWDVRRTIESMFQWVNIKTNKIIG